MASTDLHADSDPPAASTSGVIGLLDPEVARAAHGDRGAFEHIYHQHVQRVYAICVRMTGRRDEADELTQDVFVRAWEKLPTFRGDAAFSTWLHRLAVNVVLEARRSARRHSDRHAVAPVDDKHDTIADRSPDALAMCDRVDLTRAMATLPTGARAIFALHDIEGYTHEEIAHMLGITAGGSKAQLHRARHLLRETLT